jgi:hypothetical protein
MGTIRSTLAKGDKAMSNPLMKVISALYGAPGATVDVTQTVQNIFDQEYNNPGTFRRFTLTSIEPGLFNIQDPAPGVIKAFTIVYNYVGESDVFMRGAQDSQTLALFPGPIMTVQVTQAIYATNDMGLDVTDKLKAWLRDPENGAAPTLTISSQPFFNALTDGSDPAPGTAKYFSVAFIDPTYPGSPQHLCGYDGETITLVGQYPGGSAQ